MKLSPGVYFINILGTIFLYERRFSRLESGFEQTFVQKMRAKNPDEIDSRRKQRNRISSSWKMKNIAYYS